MKYLGWLVLIVIVIGGAWYAFGQNGGPAPEEAAEETTLPTAGDAEVMEEDAAAMVQEIVVNGSNFKFDKTEIRVKEGETVRVVFNNTQGTHDWVIDEFDARTAVIKSGESETIEFVADKKGSFEYYCSVGEHRALGMVGTLIVE